MCNISWPNVRLVSGFILWIVIRNSDKQVIVSIPESISICRNISAEISNK